MRPVRSSAKAEERISGSRTREDTIVRAEERHLSIGLDAEHGLLHVARQRIVQMRELSLLSLLRFVEHAVVVNRMIGIESVAEFVEIQRPRDPQLMTIN